MIRTLISIAALCAVTACGDGTFIVANGDVTEEDVEETGIPDAISSSVSSFTYNPAAGTLTLTGTLRDGDELTTTFARKPALDVRDAQSGAVVYEAFSAQDDPLDEHTTVYARVLGDVSAGVGVTGGQFTYYSGGALYGRSGGFDPAPQNEDADTGLVTYAGQYAGLTNLNGPRTDMLPVPGSVDPAVIPSQAGPVTGRVFINVSFSDSNLAGVIYDREVSSEAFGTFEVSDLILVPTELAADGTFTGEVEFPSNRQDVGSYGGLIGGNQGEALAGAIFVEEHFGDPLTDGGGNPIAITGEEEFGIFVLGRCGGALQDASAECDDPPVDPL